MRTGLRVVWCCWVPVIALSAGCDFGKSDSGGGPGTESPEQAVARYNLVTHDAGPILLETFGDAGSVRYRYPQVLDNGLLFVQALVSPSGSVGADGPIYQVKPEDWMK